MRSVPGLPAAHAPFSHVAEPPQAVVAFGDGSQRLSQFLIERPILTLEDVLGRSAINRRGGQRAAGAVHSKLRSSSVLPWPR